MESVKARGVLLIVFVSFLDKVVSDLKISGNKCGVKTCKTLEYCSAFDNQCYPCSNICNEKIHNYDPLVCTRDCQDYIHDARYVRKDSGTYGNSNEDLQATVQRLQYTLTVTLTLLCLVILILLTYAIIQIWKWKKKNNVTFSSLKEKFCLKKSNNESKTSPNNGIPIRQIGKQDLRIDMPSPGTHAGDHSPVTVTTSISRRPAEDSALDYAYDNRAMSNTPSPH